MLFPFPIEEVVRLLFQRLRDASDVLHSAGINCEGENLFPGTCGMAPGSKAWPQAFAPTIGLSQSIF
jgi:hypothetical protein